MQCPLLAGAGSAPNRGRDRRHESPPAPRNRHEIDPVKSIGRRRRRPGGLRRDFLIFSKRTLPILPVPPQQAGSAIVLGIRPSRKRSSPATNERAGREFAPTAKRRVHSPRGEE